MPRYVIQPNVEIVHNGKALKAGDFLELSAEAAARKLARGDIKPAPAGKAEKTAKAAADEPPAA